MDTSLYKNCAYQLKAEELMKEMEFLQNYQEKGIQEEDYEEISNKERSV